MRALDLIRNAAAGIARAVSTQRRLSRFTCGDCERWQRCGLPPSAACAHRAAAMVRDDWRDKRPATLPQQW